MKQQDFRTYRRRATTRTSGYHTCGEATGGECLIVNAQKHTMKENEVKFSFYRDNISLIELFSNDIGIVAFGGYIFTHKDIKVSFTLSAKALNHETQETTEIGLEKAYLGPIIKGDWNGIGFHKEISLDVGTELNDLHVQMVISSEVGNVLEFLSFDLDVVSKDEFKDDVLQPYFYQRTAMHIPHIYYLDTVNQFDKYQTDNPDLETGRLSVLKSCNRCGRRLPINIDNELNTLAYSLHCKKRAPCVHSLFSSYKIENLSECNDDILNQLNVSNNTYSSYYGHQLECRACKKFFVNGPLNPQRNSQQFREDGLRRRAIENLINNLLQRNLVHFEFEKRNKKQFSEYIWNKFGQRCFKCNKKLKLEEMHLDHTMPCAYLYRLDESATCLCSEHNSQKRDRFPADYYSPQELIKLSKITGLSIDELQKKTVNKKVLKLLVDNIVWYYDDFLMDPDYQKIRDGIKTADKINDSLKRVISGYCDLAEEYKKVKGRYPTSVTIYGNSS